MRAHQHTSRYINPTTPHSYSSSPSSSSFSSSTAAAFPIRGCTVHAVFNLRCTCDSRARESCRGGGVGLLCVANVEGGWVLLFFSLVNKKRRRRKKTAPLALSLRRMKYRRQFRTLRVLFMCASSNSQRRLCLIHIPNKKYEKEEEKKNNPASRKTNEDWEFTGGIKFHRERVINETATLFFTIPLIITINRVKN